MIQDSPAKNCNDDLGELLPFGVEVQDYCVVLQGVIHLCVRANGMAFSLGWISTLQTDRVAISLSTLHVAIRS